MSVERFIELPGADEEWIREVSSDDEEEIEVLSSDEISENTEEMIRTYNHQACLEVWKEVKASDPVYQNCDYRRFVSQSNGRSRRKRKARIIEFLWFGENCVTLKGDDIVGGIDSKATEILGESVDPALATDTLLRRARGLKKLK